MQAHQILLPPANVVCECYVFYTCLSVILFTGGGVCLSACWDTTPQDQTPPPVHSKLGDTVNARAVRILLECNLLQKYFCSHYLISDTPKVVLKDLEVTKTRMWIFWEYSTSNAKSKGNGYTFYVQIHYRKTSDNQYRADGTKISADQVPLRSHYC